MREAGLTPEFVIADAYSEEAGANAMHRLLAKNAQTARPRYSEPATCWRSARWRAARADGITVPSDIAVVGFDDIPAAKLLGLTTVRQPEFQLGTLAARVLIERLKPGGMIPPGQSLELKFEIITRTSA